MSFSIPLEGSTPPQVYDAADAALQKIVGEQPVHAADMDAALRALAGYLEVMGTAPVGMHIAGSLTGSVGFWNDRVQSLGISINLQFVMS